MKVGGLSVGLNPGTVALGAAAYLFGPSLMKIVTPVVRSAAKTGIKGGLLLYGRGKEAVSDVQLRAKDLAEEARTEVSKELTTGKK
jgi:hypothetical protein